MALNPVTKYGQTRYSRGVCFRLSFKWAALSLAGGTFNFATDTAGLNVQSTINKHVQYRSVSAATEKDTSYNFLDKGKFDDYVKEDGNQAVQYINQWGLRFKGSKGSGHTIYNGVSVADRREQTLTAYFAAERNASGSTLVYGYYGHLGNGPAGHAVAYSKGEFFDSNSGLWTCAPPDTAGADIDTYITKYYTKWTPEKFVIFVLAHK